jgi:hypothetical protein
MKDSVMEGQPMFSVTKRNENLQMSPESSTFADGYDWTQHMLDEDYISEQYAEEMDAFQDAMVAIRNASNETERKDAYKKKAKAIYDFIRKLDGSEQPIYMMSSIESIVEELTEQGFDLEFATNVYNMEVEDRKLGYKTRGAEYNGDIFLMAEHIDSLVAAQLIYSHEVQHVWNFNNASYLEEIVKFATPEELLDVVRTIGGLGYEDLLEMGVNGYIQLADEAIAHAVMYGYTLEDANFVEELKHGGIKNEALINLLNEEYERRKGSTPYMFHRNRRIQEDLQGKAVHSKTDGGDVQGRAKQVQRTERKRLTYSGYEGSRIGERELNDLRLQAVTILQSRADVPTITFDSVRFSVTGAPTPTPTETKGE